jgi:hypothetical protein
MVNVIQLQLLAELQILTVRLHFETLEMSR